MGNFKPTVCHPWFSFYLRFHALKRCRTRGVCNTERSVLAATIGKDLALQLKWMKTRGKTVVSSHPILGAVIGELIL